MYLFIFFFKLHLFRDSIRVARAKKNIRRRSVFLILAPGQLFPMYNLYEMSYYIL